MGKEQSLTEAELKWSYKMSNVEKPHKQINKTYTYEDFFQDR